MNMFNKSSLRKAFLTSSCQRDHLFVIAIESTTPESGSFDNRTKSVSVVKTRNLSRTFGNKTSLETLNGSIKQIFNTKHSFRAHDVGVGRARNQSPSIILL